MQKNAMCVKSIDSGALGAGLINLLLSFARQKVMWVKLLRLFELVNQEKPIAFLWAIVVESNMAKRNKSLALLKLQTTS